MELTINEIKEAARRIEPYIHRTPVLTCGAIDQLCGARLFFKCENFQKVGAFKARGATNAVFSLSDEQARRGVTTHSSGNHAAALALAASKRGIKAYVVMPSNAPAPKNAAVAGYGADIRFCEPTLEARQSGVEEVIAETGATFIHPYNNYTIIAGQGTAALELCTDFPDLDFVSAPVGGGGLLSGTAIAVTDLLPGAQVIAGEPEMADDAFRSLEAGTIIPSNNPNTICDGLKTSLGDKTFSIISKKVKKIITVSEDEVVRAMRLVWERMKIIIEPSSAVPLAVVIKTPALFNDSKVGVIFSGGNVDLEALPWQKK